MKKLLLALVTLCFVACNRYFVGQQQDNTSPHVGTRWVNELPEREESRRQKPKAPWQEAISALCSAEAMQRHGMPDNGRYVPYAEAQRDCLRREYRNYRKAKIRR